MPDQMNSEDLEAKKQALLNLQKAGLFDAKTDDPENLLGQKPQPTPDQTMQANPQNLIDALKRKNQEDQLKGLFPSK